MVKFSEVKKLLRRRSMSLSGVRLVVLKQHHLLLFNTTNLAPIRDILRRLRSFITSETFTIDMTFCIQIQTFENTRLFLVIFNF